MQTIIRYKYFYSQALRSFFLPAFLFYFAIFSISSFGSDCSPPFNKDQISKDPKNNLPLEKEISLLLTITDIPYSKIDNSLKKQLIKKEADESTASLISIFQAKMDKASLQKYDASDDVLQSKFISNLEYYIEEAQQIIKKDSFFRSDSKNLDYIKESSINRLFVILIYLEVLKNKTLRNIIERELPDKKQIDFFLSLQKLISPLSIRNIHKLYNEEQIPFVEKILYFKNLLTIPLHSKMAKDKAFLNFLKLNTFSMEKMTELINIKSKEMQILLAMLSRSYSTEQKQINEAYYKNDPNFVSNIQTNPENKILDEKNVAITTKYRNATKEYQEAMDNFYILNSISSDLSIDNSNFLMGMFFAESLIYQHKNYIKNNIYFVQIKPRDSKVKRTYFINLLEQSINLHRGLLKYLPETEKELQKIILKKIDTLEKEEKNLKRKLSSEAKNSNKSLNKKPNNEQNDNYRHLIVPSPSLLHEGKGLMYEKALK